MSENKLNISKHTNGILKQLGLDPTFVRQLLITPTTVTATVYKRNADGAKYIEPAVELLPGGDAEDVSCFDNGHPAIETIEYEVRT